jgi:hypothetical protein
MIERMLYEIVSDKLQWFKDDPRRFETFLREHHGLSEEEAHAARTYFEVDPESTPDTPGGPPHLTHGFPQTSGPFPCWAIILTGDGIRQRYIGDDVGMDYDTDDEDFVTSTDLDGNDADRVGWWQEDRIEIHTYVQWVPDVMLYYYRLLRHILISEIQRFTDAGMTLASMSGRDLMPDERYMPKGMWIRALALTFEHDADGLVTVQRGTEVDGAFVDDGAESEGVQKQITPLEE